MPARATLVADIVRERTVTIETLGRAVPAARRRTSALEFANRRANEYAEAARDYLGAFPAGPERDALAALAEYVLTRDR